MYTENQMKVLSELAGRKVSNKTMNKYFDSLEEFEKSDVYFQKFLKEKEEYAFAGETQQRLKMQKVFKETNDWKEKELIALSKQLFTTELTRRDVLNYYEKIKDNPLYNLLSYASGNGGVSSFFYNVKSMGENGVLYSKEQFEKLIGFADAEWNGNAALRSYFNCIGELSNGALKFSDVLSKIEKYGMNGETQQRNRLRKLLENNDKNNLQENELIERTKELFENELTRESVINYYDEVKDYPSFKLLAVRFHFGKTITYFNNVKNFNLDKQYWVAKLPIEKSDKLIEQGVYAIYYTQHDVGDLSQYKNRSEMEVASDSFGYENEGKARNDSLALWDISHNMKIGDRLYIVSGNYNIIGTGVVTSKYFYDQETKMHKVKVDYNIFENAMRKTETPLPQKTLTKLDVNGKSFEAIQSVLNEFEDDDDFVDQEIVCSKKFEQLIIQGPPGSGKSYQLNKRFENEQEFVTRVTFYPDYEYYNFVGSIQPQLNEEKNLEYTFVPGPFTIALKNALEDPGNMYYLIVEEMSRGNCSAIFGDILQLLDRNENGNSMYPIHEINLQKYLGRENIIIPNNLSIFGTVNSSDQNVFTMDTAFRRRFDLEVVTIDDMEVKEDFDIKLNGSNYSWNKLYKQINKFLEDKLEVEEDKLIGPYMIKKSDNATNKLAVYLYSDITKSLHIEDNHIFAKQYINSLGKIVRDIESKKVFTPEFLDFINEEKQEDE